MNTAPTKSLLACLLVALLFPLFASAESTVVVFFSGLCNSPDACSASQQAFDAIGPRLPEGTKLLIPNLNGGKFSNQANLNTVLSSLGSGKIVFIPYSAGNQALWQVVSSMDTAALQRVKSIVSLEAEYSGLTNSVNRVRTVNPNVDVRYVNSSQFNTNHGRLPGNDGVAKAIAGLVGGDQSDLPTRSAAYDPNRPLPQQFNLNPQTSAYPPITSSMPVASQAPIATAFTPQSAPMAPYAPAPAPPLVSDTLLSSSAGTNIPSALITDSLFGSTSVASSLLVSLNIPSSTTFVLTSPSAPTTFVTNPPPAAPTWMSAPLAAFDIRQQISEMLTKAESILRGILQRLY